VKDGLKPITLCFGLHGYLSPGIDAEEAERIYQEVYKPLISALYANPALPFSLYLSGSTIDWIEPRHPEFFMILEELVARKQVEAIGGGARAPIFPLIPPVDRVGQIEALTTKLRKLVGKKPRGAWVPLSAWDPSMVASFVSCGIEYLFLDKQQISTSGYQGVDGFGPVVIEDSGKTVIALPLDNRFMRPEALSPRAFLEAISADDGAGERLVVVFFGIDSVKPLFAPEKGPGWMDAFLKLIEPDSAAVRLSTPSAHLKGTGFLPRAYVPAGLAPHVVADSIPDGDARVLARTPAKYLLTRSACAHNLYAKMMYVHALVSQLRGDKSRKKSAREDIWRAQGSEFYLASAPRALRVAAYRHLIQAERAARTRGVFSPSILPVDFDMDGQREFLCQLDRLNVYVHPRGGRVFECDVIDAYRNFADGSCGAHDGMFVDHFVAHDEIADVVSGKRDLSNGVFSEAQYQEAGIDAVRHELSLRATGQFGAFQQPVSLRKQYAFRNEGIQVQYILKNESPMNLSGVFLIEISIPASPASAQALTLYARDARREVPVARGHFSDVSWFQCDDAASAVKFTLEANENPSIAVFPIPEPPAPGKKRPAGDLGVRLCLYWKADLSPGFEMEKMVFMKIDS